MPAIASPWGELKPAFGYACAGYGRAGSEYASCDGLADLATDQKFSLRTRVNCGSVGKLVTAYFVTRIWSNRVDRERLRMGSLLPGLPAPAAGVTVEDCLTHATGLWDFRSLIPLFGERSTFAYGVSDALAIAVKQLDLVPGYARQYSNTNYLLLGLAVERETGTRLQDVVTGWLGSDVGNFVCTPRAVVPQRARGYEVADDGSVLEFGSFVDGRGSTNYWANGEELATLAARVTQGYTNLPVYGGLQLRSGMFYAAGQDGGFRAGAVIDADNQRCHVALTNDPTLDPLDMMGTHVALRSGPPAKPSRVEESPSDGPDHLDGSFTCAALGVSLSLAATDDGGLVVSVGDRALGRLECEGPGSFSDGHLDIVARSDTIYLSINHAKGIPLERAAS